MVVIVVIVVVVLMVVMVVIVVSVTRFSTSIFFHELNPSGPLIKRLD